MYSVLNTLLKYTCFYMLENITSCTFLLVFKTGLRLGFCVIHEGFDADQYLSVLQIVAILSADAWRFVDVTKI